MPEEPVSRYYTSQRLKLHYAVWGDEANPPLLLIHGNRDHARTWDDVAVRLKRVYCVYAVDLRGHGDSAWAVGGQYSLPEFVLDVAMLAKELARDPLTIVGHSLGGAVALEYAGVFPEAVLKVVAIEGLGPSVGVPTAASVRMRRWIGDMQAFDKRVPRRYASVDDAVKRMREENPHLTAEMAHHLTVHGARANEDGTLTWKFDNYVRLHSPYEFNIAEAREIWNQIRCPVLLVRGSESWASDPEADGKASAFHTYRTVLVKDAGHWVHHDQIDAFMDEVWRFLREDQASGAGAASSASALPRASA
ncbi:MAG: alpha/beta hydrolase [Chloroflexota bacterium]|nr:alpha/beta hydrolase [Chloroflexota bacterium]